MPQGDSIRDAILQLVNKRGAGKSCCPSEVARMLSTDWRPLMKEVRREAFALAEEGRVSITQSGQPVAPDLIKGPFRISLRK